MASPAEITIIVIEKIDGIFRCTKDRDREPKAFARICEGYFGAFRNTPPAQLLAAVEHIIADWEGPYWPTPARIRKYLPDDAPSPKGAWTAMPAKWRWDSRLVELRRLCSWGSEQDPLIAIANELSHRITTDPWLCMRNAMVLRAGSGVWEKFGDESYPCYSAEAVFVARNLVEQTGRKLGIQIDLSTLPLDRVDASDGEQALVVLPHREFF